jgi:hypothetical protein
LTEAESLELLAIQSKYIKLRKPLYEARAGKIAKCRGFWGHVLCNTPALRHAITPADVPVLRFLQVLRVDFLSDDRPELGYSITFEFSDDPSSGLHPIVWVQKVISFSEDGEATITVKTEPKDANVGNHVEGATFMQWLLSSDEEDLEVADVILEDVWRTPLVYYEEGEV